MKNRAKGTPTAAPVLNDDDEDDSTFKFCWSMSLTTSEGISARVIVMEAN
jgi:hypothetical protein